MVHFKASCRFAIPQANVLAADLANLEVNAAASLPAGIVIKPNDKDVNGQVGDCISSHFSVDGDPLGIAHAPIIFTLTGVGNLLDSGPCITIQGGCGYGYGHATGLIRRSRVVRARRHLDGNGGGALGLGAHGHAHRGHVGVAGCGGHSPVSGPRHGNGAGHGAHIQHHAGLVQCTRSRRLADGPGHRLGRRGPIAPLVIGLERESSHICTGIGAGSCTTNGHFCGVVSTPNGG